MSIIYGIVMFNDQPVKQEVLENMKTAMEFTNPDKEALWVNDNVALGSLIKFVAPESFKEVHPIFFEDNQKVMVVSARIDNRDDLCAVFHIALIHRDNYPDSHYVRLAFEKWGEECCDHLLGDWSFAVYDKTLKKLYVARDHCGIMACYYYSCAEFFAFSSSPKGLLALKEIPKEINEFRLAQILIARPGNGEQTCYLNIFNIQSGHYLTIENAKIRKIKYWDLQKSGDLFFSNEQDYYDHFLEIFTGAVKCRLRTNKQVGISLSGGLDSTSVAAIAAIELAKQNKELFGFTSVPHYKDYKIPKGRNCDESYLSGLFAKKYKNIKHFLVKAEKYNPIECIKKAVDIFDEPMHAAANQYWIQAVNEKAIDYNCNIMLNGQAGNSTISWPTGKIKSVNQGGIYHFKSLLKNISEFINDSVFHYNSIKDPILKYSEINPLFAEELDLVRTIKEDKYDLSNIKKLSFKESQYLFINQIINSAYQKLYKYSIFYGSNSLDPTGDKNLIQFSYKMPEVFFRKHSYNKIFILFGMRKFLLEEIINSKKGIQGCDISQRIKKSDRDFLLPQLSMESFQRYIDCTQYSQPINSITMCKNISLLFYLKRFT